jgi:hypothetical protein
MTHSNPNRIELDDSSLTLTLIVFSMTHSNPHGIELDDSSLTLTLIVFSMTHSTTKRTLTKRTRSEH